MQIKTVNYYTHIITLPTTLRQVLILLDSVYTSIWGIMYSVSILLT